MKAKTKCPECSHKQAMDIPENKCLAFYQCEECMENIFPKTGDCCVICSYSDKKCHSSTNKK